MFKACYQHGISRDGMGSNLSQWFHPDHYSVAQILEHGSTLCTLTHEYTSLTRKCNIIIYMIIIYSEWCYHGYRHCAYIYKHIQTICIHIYIYAEFNYRTYIVVDSQVLKRWHPSCAPDPSKGPGLFRGSNEHMTL